MPLHFLHVPGPGARAGAARTMYQEAGPILVEVPLAEEVCGTPGLLGFTALGRG